MKDTVIRNSIDLVMKDDDCRHVREAAGALFSGKQLEPIDPALAESSSDRKSSDANPSPPLNPRRRYGAHEVDDLPPALPKARSLDSAMPGRTVDVPRDERRRTSSGV